MASSQQKSDFPLHFDTLGVHAGLNRLDGQVGDAPVYASTSFAFKNSAHGAAIFAMEEEAFCYSRIGNPTVSVFEQRIAALEGGPAALATASVQAALFLTITSLAENGSNIIIASPIADATSNQFKFRLSRMGIEARFVHGGSIAELSQAINTNTKAVFAESLTTDGLLVSDIEALANVAHEAGIPLIIDNTAGAGGYFIRPLQHGADIVIHSTTEFLSISGSSLGGAVVDGGTFPWNKYQDRFPQFTEPLPAFHGIRMWEKFGKLSFLVFARAAVLRDTGPCMNPFEASQLLLGLPTLAIRMEKVSGNALALAKWLHENSKVQSVKYPGIPSHPSSALSKKYLTQGNGGVLSFSLNDAFSIPTALTSSLKVVSLGTSIGGSRTVTITRSDTLDTGAIPDLGRDILVSVGLEHIDDIIRDFGILLADS